MKELGGGGVGGGLAAQDVWLGGGGGGGVGGLGAQDVWLP